MADLKRGWKRVVLGNLVDVITDYWDRNPDVPERFVAGEHIDEGDLRIRRWGTTSDDLVPPTFNRRFRAGDVLFHSRNLNKLACPDFAGITGEKLFVLRAKDSNQLLPQLLPFLLQTNAFNEYVSRMWAGSTNKFLNKAPLVKYEFALPPLEEQRRIAIQLQHAHQATEACQSLSQHAGTLPDCLISHFLRRALGSDLPLRMSAGQHPCDVKLVRAGDVLRARQGLQISQRDRSPTAGPGLFPYLTTQYLLHGGVVEYVPASYERVVCTRRDILVVRTGMTNGQVFTELEGVFHNNFFAIDYDDAVLERDFIVAYLRHPNVSRLMRALSGATNIPDLNHGDFYSVPFALPTITQQRLLLEHYGALRVTANSASARCDLTRQFALTTAKIALEGA